MRARNFCIEKKARAANTSQNCYPLANALSFSAFTSLLLSFLCSLMLLLLRYLFYSAAVPVMPFDLPLYFFFASILCSLHSHPTLLSRLLCLTPLFLLGLQPLTMLLSVHYLLIILSFVVLLSSLPSPLLFSTPPLFLAFPFLCDCS